MHTPIEFNNSYYKILLIENKEFLRRFVEDLYIEDQEEEDIFKLSLDLKRQKFSQNVYIIGDIFNINLNTTKIQNLIIRQMQENLLLSDSLNDRGMEIVRDINLLIDRLGLQLSYQIDSKEIDLYDIIKMNKIKFFHESDSLVNLLNVIKFLSHELEIRLIVLVNLMTLVRQEEFNEITYFLELEKINVLFVETTIYEGFYDENIIVIDDDLCIF